MQLEAHLAETHRQAQRLIKKQSELGSSLGDFGSSLLGLGKFEQPPLADKFMLMGEKSALLARNSQVGSGVFRTDANDSLSEQGFALSSSLTQLILLHLILRLNLDRVYQYTINSLSLCLLALLVS